MHFQASVMRLFLILGFVLVSTFWIQHELPVHIPSLQSYHTEKPALKISDTNLISWDKAPFDFTSVCNTIDLHIAEAFKIGDVKCASTAQYLDYLHSNKKAAFAFYISKLKDIG